MHTKSILIPANPKLILKNHKVLEKCQLTGLLHKNIKMELARTPMNPDVKNIMATEIIQYMLNPCVIYNNLEVYGDAILIVHSDTKMDDNTIMKLINIYIDFKKNGNMPIDLKSYLDHLLSMDIDELRKRHIKESMEQYGVKKTINLPSINNI